MAAVNRLWLLLLATLVTALGPLSTPPAVGQDYPAIYELEGPSVSATHGNHSLALRGEERVELRTAEQRLLDAGASDPCVSASVPAPQHSESSATWHGLVQCRRLAGAQLLHFATPPPARG